MQNRVDETLAIMLRAISDLTDHQQVLAGVVKRLERKRKRKA